MERVCWAWAWKAACNFVETSCRSPETLWRQMEVCTSSSSFGCVAGWPFVLEMAVVVVVVDGFVE